MKRKFKHTAQLLLFVIILTTAMLAWPATVSADTAVRLSGLSPGDTVQFAGYTWIVLNPSTGYLIMRDVLCNRAFDSSGRADPAFDPSRTSCLAYYLNSDSGGFYNSLLNSCPTDAALIQTHAWTIGTNSGTTNNEASSTVDAKIGLLSYSEYYTYKKISGVYSSWYWTRTWTTGDQYVWTTCEDSNSMYAVPDYYINYLVRPALYLEPAVQVSGGNGGKVIPFSAGNSTVSVTNASVAVTTSSEVIVRIKDYSGQPVSGIPVQLSSSSATALVNNSGTFASVTTGMNGEATFTVTDTKAETVTYTAKDTTYNQQLTQTAQVQFAPGAANQLVWYTKPSGSGIAGTALGNQPVLCLEDQFGNILTNDNSTKVTLTASGGELMSGNTVTVSAGVAAFANLMTNNAGTFTLTASNGEGITSEASDQTTIESAAANQLIWHTQPSTNGTAGMDLSVQPVLYLEDQFGNIVNDDNSTQVTLTASGGEPLRGDTVTVSAGVAAFTNLKTDKADKITLTANNGGSITSAISDQITIASAEAKQLTVTPSVNTLDAGTAFDITVTAKDQYGNTATGYKGTVDFSTDSDNSPGGDVPSLPESYTFTSDDSGTHTFTRGVTFYNNGTATLSVNDTTNSLSVTSELITVNPGSVNAGRSTVIASAKSVEADGSEYSNIYVTLVDAYKNPIIGKLVKLVTTGGNSAITADYDTSNKDGMAAFKVADTKAEVVTYAAQTEGVTADQTATVNFLPGPPTKLVWHTQPSISNTAGAILNDKPVLYLEDQNNNLETGNSIDTVSISLTTAKGASLAGNKTVRLSAGIATFDGLSVDKVGTYTITATCGAITCSPSDNFNIIAGTPSVTRITVNHSSVQADGLSQSTVSVVVCDAYNNPVPNATVTLNTNLGILTDSTVTTDSNGQASSTITSNTAGAASISVNGGGRSSPARVDFIPMMTITGLSPSNCSVTGGTLVNIKGSGLNLVTEVYFGSAAGTIYGTPTSESLSVYAPQGPANGGSVHVVLRGPGGPSAETDNSLFNYIAPVSPSSNSEGGSSTTDTKKTGTNDAITITTSTIATVDNNGKAVASVTQEQVNDAVSQAVAAASKQGEDTEARIEIKVTAPAGTKTVETSIPSVAVNGMAKSNTGLTVSTPVAAITFDSGAIDTISKATGDVKITATAVDSATLPVEAHQVVGDRPVYNFSVTSGNNTISRFGGNVTVSVPYTPKAGEDTNAIVIYYINAQGKPEIVSDCAYDPATGTVRFSTNHFSTYAVGYNKVNYQDVPDSAWYSKPVSYIAARDIPTGTDSGYYNPNAKLNRGDFLVMLMRAYGIEPDASPKDNFSDAGSTYYTGYLAAAKRLGIAGGVGNNNYAPDKAITRQEMFTLLYNALKVLDKLPRDTSSGKALSNFGDAGKIASWAKDAMTLFVKTGTIGGSYGKLSPTGTMTRAEMAQVLYNLLAK